MSNTVRDVVRRTTAGAPRRTPLTRPVARLILLAALLISLAALAAGLPSFLRGATRDAPEAARADAIVVLTGGSLRIERGLSLLRARAAGRMLISGVGDGVTLASLLASMPDAAFRPPEPDRITLGHAARTTTGNAAEIAAWSRALGLRSLIVVTAGYHMPRAMAELRAALPGVALTPCPVHPPAGIRIVALEYAKYLAAVLDLAIRPDSPRIG